MLGSLLLIRTTPFTLALVQYSIVYWRQALYGVDDYYNSLEMKFGDCGEIRSKFDLKVIVLISQNIYYIV